MRREALSFEEGAVPAAEIGDRPAVSAVIERGVPPRDGTVVEVHAARRQPADDHLVIGDFQGVRDSDLSLLGVREGDELEFVGHLADCTSACIACTRAHFSNRMSFRTHRSRT